MNETKKMFDIANVDRHIYGAYSIRERGKCDSYWSTPEEAIQRCQELGEDRWEMAVIAVWTIRTETVDSV